MYIVHKVLDARLKPLGIDLGAMLFPAKWAELFPERSASRAGMVPRHTASRRQLSNNLHGVDDAQQETNPVDRCNFTTYFLRYIYWTTTL
jgi:hypothetical protein